MQNRRSIPTVGQTAGYIRMAALALTMLLGSSGCPAETPLLKRMAHSPTNLGTALLVTDNSSFGGADAWVYVSDPKKGADVDPSIGSSKRAVVSHQQGRA